MVQEPVEDRAGDHGVAEHFAPGTETLIAGNNDRATLVTPRDQLEEQVGALAVNRQVADLIDYEQLGLSQELEPLFQPPFGQRLAQRSNQRGRGDEQRAHTLLASLNAKRDR